LSEEKEYDLKKSAEGIGQLYPILEAKDGEVIDGIHREDADKNWKRIRLEHIDTEEKKLVARLTANFHRRIVPYMEKKTWINDLAEIYKKQELTTSIANKIVEVTGLSPWTVYQYLNDEYKDKKQQERATALRSKPESVAEQIVTDAAHHRLDKQKAQELVERHREEVKQELLENEDFQREATEKFVESTQKKSDASSQALQEAGIPPVPEQIETFVEKAVEVLKQHPPAEKLWSPREKRDFILAFLSRQKISCSICGETKLAWKCGHKFE